MDSDQQRIREAYQEANELDQTMFRKHCNIGGGNCCYANCAHFQKTEVKVEYPGSKSKLAETHISVIGPRCRLWK